MLRVGLLVAILFTSSSFPAVASQARIVDDFESLSGWKAVTGHGIQRWNTHQVIISALPARMEPIYD